MTCPSGSLVFCGLRKSVSYSAVTPNYTRRDVRRKFSCIVGLLVRKKVGQILLSIPREVFRRSSYSSECPACCFQLRFMLRPLPCAAGSIPGRRPGALVWDEREQ